MKKMKNNYNARVQEHQKAKDAAIKAEGGQQPSQLQATAKPGGSGTGPSFGSAFLGTGSNTNKVDKKKKQEDDASSKVGLIALLECSSC